MNEWGIILYFLLFGVLMFVAKILKTWIPGLNKIVIPTALLAGILGLILSMVLTPLLPASLWSESNQFFFSTYVGEGDVAIPYNSIYNIDLLQSIVYHGLAIGFLALALKRDYGDQKKAKKKIWSTGMLITSTYALQAVLGMILVFAIFQTRFIGSGMLVALGFGQGPGLASSIGKMWNDALGGGTTGITLGAAYATMGFLFGGIVGVLAINVIARRKGFSKPQQYDEPGFSKKTVEIHTVKQISVLDGLTTSAIMIAVIYGLTWLTLVLFQWLFGFLGSAGDMAFGILKGFNFIVAILYALAYNQLLKALEKRGKEVRFLTNNYMLSNIASTAFNIMIAAGVMMITLEFLSEYGIQLIVTSIVAGLGTIAYLAYMTRKVYVYHKDEYFIGLFGMLTGVASTGLALLKGVDPELETPVAEELVLGSGTAITMALPLFAILFIPTFTANSANPVLWTWIALFGATLYIVIMVVILLVRGKRKVNV